MPDKIPLSGYIGDINFIEHEVKITNNFIGQVTNAYNGHSPEIKKISLTVDDYDSFAALFVLLYRPLFGITLTQAKVLVGMIELSNTESVVVVNELVLKYLSERLGLIEQVISNNIPALIRMRMIVRTEATVYKINRNVWMFLKGIKNEKKLVIEINYKPDTNI